MGGLSLLYDPALLGLGLRYWAWVAGVMVSGGDRHLGIINLKQTGSHKHV